MGGTKSHCTKKSFFLNAFDFLPLYFTKLKAKRKARNHLSYFWSQKDARNKNFKASQNRFYLKPSRQEPSVRNKATKRAVRVIFSSENEGLISERSPYLASALLCGQAFSESITDPYHSYFSIHPTFPSKFCFYPKLLFESHFFTKSKSK